MPNPISTEAYHPVDWYPSLAEIQPFRQEIKEEAVAALADMAFVQDERARQQTWRVFPLKPEPEDLPNVPVELIESSRAKAPFTCQLLENLPGVIAYAFSSLAPHATIAPHKHENPYVTAVICLQAAGDVYMVNGGERSDLREGETLVFDYTQTHEVINNSDTERIVLLVLMNNVLKSGQKR